MKLIVGLGNPGDSYSGNRHNVGQIIIDALNAYLAGRHKSTHTMSPRSQMKILQSEVFEYRPKVILANTKNFMNDSGLSISKLVDRYKIKMDDLYIIHDDLDIKLGEFKIQKGKGPHGHNGVNSIEEHLGKDNFWRVRVGVENRDTDNKIPGETYVLQNFGKDEEVVLKKVIEQIAEELIKL